MKILEKTGLALFSTLILILSIITCLLIFGWIDLEWIYEIIEYTISDEVTSNIVLGLNTVFILLAIRCIFFDSSSKESDSYKNGIMLENEDGKLLITKETLENLVKNTVSGFDSAEDVSNRIEFDRENNLIIYVNLAVKENAVIKELSMNLQNKIKETIKNTTDLEVKEVNVKIKDIQAKSGDIQ